MDALALCKIETVEIALSGSRGSYKIGRVTAHRYLDFAAHRYETGDMFRQRWCITHLPSGRLAAEGFASIEPTVTAMVEIARLRNDWSCVDDEGAGGEVSRKVEEIIKRHDPRAKLAGGRKGEKIENKLNGYAEQSA